MRVIFLCFLLIFSNYSYSFAVDSIKKDVEKKVSKEVEDYVKDKIEKKKKESKLYQIIVKVFNIIKSILIGIKNFIIKVIRLILSPFINGRKSSVFMYRQI